MWLHLLDERPACPTSEIAERTAAYAFRKQRDAHDIKRLDDEVKAYMAEAVEAFDITARGYDKITHVARTIADLEACESIAKPHLQEALAYRKIRLLS